MSGSATVRAVRFDCEGVALAGILDVPAHAPPAPVGVVVVVGGPQTRVGSHRQFTLLARHLASAGFATLRFDHRGMGDSDGDSAGFEHLGPEIDAAVATLQAQCPEVRHVVLWGLCDAAAAIMMNGWRVPAAVGLVLLNPWVRTQSTQAKTLVRHYYSARFFDPKFWGNLLKGKVDVWPSLRELFANLRKSRGRGGARGEGPTPDDPSLPFPERMRLGMEHFGGEVLLVLSGNDLTAAEFRDLARDREDWRALLEGSTWSHRDLPEATHTFSSAAWRDRVAGWTVDWLRDLAER